MLREATALEKKLYDRSLADEPQGEELLLLAQIYQEAMGSNVQLLRRIGSPQRGLAFWQEEGEEGLY